MEYEGVAAVLAQIRPTGYFDRNGRPVEVDEYLLLMADPDYHQVTETVLSEVRISTKFDGVQPYWQGIGAPQLFRTTIHGGARDGWSQTCPTELCARSCHAQLVTNLRKVTR
ncbi:hypothetical protein OG563_26745 [Nocardia vinacea]|uniref:Uncharacterized protein n=1 Tax=Nocardia vinacea TaxID=96468 RepID=A0ABZ1YLI4_9NOCA|nr:hypothetical protein [Nocardia vinacea]